MARDDLRFDIGFFNNLKTRKLLKKFGDHGVTCIIRIWCYAGERHPNGTLVGFDSGDLEEIGGWAGKRGAFASYVIRERWVDKAEDGTLSIHDWPEHQPWVSHAESRSDQARAAVNVRWERKRAAQAKEITTGPIRNVILNVYGLYQSVIPRLLFLLLILLLLRKTRIGHRRAMTRPSSFPRK